MCSSDLEIVAEASTGAEALALAHKTQPDVILMDISLPDMSGFAVTSALKKELPDVRVLTVSFNDSREYVEQSLSMGAIGYMLKDAPAAELIEAINSVFERRPYFSPSVRQFALDFLVNRPKQSQRTTLTPRERVVVAMAATGKTAKEIGKILGSPWRTVDTHRQHAMRKLGIKNVVTLTHWAIRNGLVVTEGKIARVSTRVVRKIGNRKSSTAKRMPRKTSRTKRA